MLQVFLHTKVIITYLPNWSLGPWICFSPADLSALLQISPDVRMILSFLERVSCVSSKWSSPVINML
jgi:hypothetical protein